MKLFSTRKFGTSHSKNAKQQRVFDAVNYRQFRRHLAETPTKAVKGSGFETAIYDRRGDIQAIIHAASIDSSGHCNPAEYFIRTSAISPNRVQAA